MRAGVRYVRHAPAFRAVLVRAAAFVSGAAGLWALLPAVARESAEWGPAGYGMMLGSMGAGAIFGTLLLPAVRRGSSADVVVAGGTIVFAASAAGVALLPATWARCLLLFPAGAAWLAALTTLSSSAQALLPAWVRARALSVYLLVFFGGMAAGSALWGAIAGPLGVPLALLASAGWMVAALAAGLRYRLPAGSPPAVEPSRHWPEAPAVPVAEYERGPVLVTVEYRVPADRAADFRATVGPLRAARLREGAIRWDLFQDVEDAERLVEVFLIESWVDHLRQHERVTDEDGALVAAARALHAGDRPPRVTHLIGASLSRTE
jgi:quinol monooxygenase YgiN